MPPRTKDAAQARPGLIIVLGCVVLLTVMAVIFLKPSSGVSSSASGENGLEQTSPSSDLSNAEGSNGSGMRLLQKTGAGNQSTTVTEKNVQTSYEDEDLIEVFHEALNQSIAIKRDQELTSLANYLATSNPEMAISLINQGWETGAKNKASVLQFSKEFATTYAKLNPQGASRFMNELPNNIQIQYGSLVASEWATTDAANATQWALSMEDQQLRNSLVHSISTTVEHSATPILIDAWANAVIQSPYAMEFSNEVTRVWPISNVGATMEWLDTFDNPGHRASSYQELATSLAGRDHRDAARWVAQFPEQLGIRDQAVDSVSYSWSKTEFEAAKAWAESMGRTLMDSDVPTSTLGTYSP